MITDPLHGNNPSEELPASAVVHIFGIGLAVKNDDHYLFSPFPDHYKITRHIKKSINIVNNDDIKVQKLCPHLMQMMLTFMIIQSYDEVIIPGINFVFLAFQNKFDKYRCFCV
jgi:hypothetical protein